MKRAALICFLVIMPMLFAGCNSSDANDNKVNNTEGSKPSSENDYKVFEKEYTAYDKDNHPFNVKYAQISGVGNESLEHQINQNLKLSMTEWINKDCEWAEKFQVDVTYKTSKYLSLRYMIEWKDSQGEDYMSTFIRIGVTIDMQTGERVYLDDLIADTESLKHKLINYNYGNGYSPPIDSEEADEIVHYASIPEMMYLEEIYKTDPLVYEFMLSYLRTKSSFYLTDKQIVITRDDYDLNDVYLDFKQ
ncbi:hypothetical protein D3C81_538660 [compost metagenome]